MVMDSSPSMTAELCRLAVAARAHGLEDLGVGVAQSVLVPVPSPGFQCFRTPQHVHMSTALFDQCPTQLLRVTRRKDATKVRIGCDYRGCPAPIADHYATAAGQGLENYQPECLLSAWQDEDSRL